ncbi:hypothetical protein D3C72_1552800 [compost metagenome]
MAHRSWLDRFTGHQCCKNIDPLRSVRVEDFAVFHQFAEQLGKLVSRFTGPECGKIVVFIRTDGFDHAARPLRPDGQWQFIGEGAAGSISADKGGAERFGSNGNPPRQIARGLRACLRQGQPPGGRVPVIALHHKLCIQNCFQIADFGFHTAAAQRNQLQRFRGFRESFIGKPETAERMFQEGNNWHGVSGPEDGLQRQLRQPGLRGGGKRRTGRVVGFDAEAL